MHGICQFLSDSNEFDFILFSVDLLALLNWKAHPDRVLDILGRLRQINGEEIVKVTDKLTLYLCSYNLLNTIDSATLLGLYVALQVIWYYYLRDFTIHLDLKTSVAN